MEIHSASNRANAQRSRYHERFTKFGSGSETRDSGNAATNRIASDECNQLPNEIVGAGANEQEEVMAAPTKHPYVPIPSCNSRVKVFSRRRARRTAGVRRQPRETTNQSTPNPSRSLCLGMARHAEVCVC